MVFVRISVRNDIQPSRQKTLIAIEIRPIFGFSIPVVKISFRILILAKVEGNGWPRRRQSMKQKTSPRLNVTAMFAYQRFRTKSANHVEIRKLGVLVNFNNR